MKVKITEERECCDVNRDLIRMIGSPPGQRFYFCKYCGRHHQDEGGSEPEALGIQPLPWPWEQSR